MRYALRMLKNIYWYVFPLLFVACSANAPAEVIFKTATITLRSDIPTEPTITLQVEIASTPQQQAVGYMNRTNIPAGTGMLFEFADEQMRSFWMKDTLIPLDIAFFNAKRELISLKTMPVCTLDPCPMYSSSIKAKYALEVPKGYFEEQGIDIGWRFGFM